MNAIHVWGLAQAFGGEVVVRIEDHDRTRCRPEYDAALLHDLRWLGLVHDDTVVQRQSERPARYERAFADLEGEGLVYACRCSRRDIARYHAATGIIADAETGDTTEQRYLNLCRHRSLDASVTRARRVMLTDAVEQFVDLRLGAMQQQPSAQCGDLLVRDRNGNWTYQFAVTVDDIADGIDVVIRGEDLLTSTGRQLHLARLLGRQHGPAVLHHALVRHADGSKLSKSNHDTGIRDRRSAGASAAELLGEAAHAAGLTTTMRPIAADALGSLFR